MSSASRQWPPHRPPRPFVVPVAVDPTGAAGPTRGAAAGPRWRRTSAGRYVPADVDATLPEQRVAEAVPLLTPGGAVTGWGALLLHGAAFLDGSGRPVPLVVGPGAGRRARTGVRFLQDRLPAREGVRGVPVAPVRRALFDEMRLAGSLVDAVVALDMAAAAELTSLARMRRFVAEHPGWDGVPLARRALELGAEHSASPQEVRVRMVWVLDLGLPPPLVNAPVFDHGGRLLGYPDLLDEEAGLVVEYDGDDHRRAFRHRDDVEREARLREAGLEVTRVTSLDLADRAGLAERLVAARRRSPFEAVGRRRWRLDDPRGRRRLSLDAVLDLRGVPR